MCTLVKVFALSLPAGVLLKDWLGKERKSSSKATLPSALGFVLVWFCSCIQTVEGPKALKTGTCLSYKLTLLQTYAEREYLRESCVSSQWGLHWAKFQKNLGNWEAQSRESARSENETKNFMYISHPPEWSKWNKTKQKTRRCSKGYKVTGTLKHCLGECPLHDHFGKLFWEHLRRLNGYIQDLWPSSSS